MSTTCYRNICHRITLNYQHHKSLSFESQPEEREFLERPRQKSTSFATKDPGKGQCTSIPWVVGDPATPCISMSSAEWWRWTNGTRSCKTHVFWFFATKMAESRRRQKVSSVNMGQSVQGTCYLEEPEETRFKRRVLSSGFWMPLSLAFSKNAIETWQLALAGSMTNVAAPFEVWKLESPQCQASVMYFNASSLDGICSTE